MVDTLVLGTSVARRGSSSLPWGTKVFRKLAQLVERLPYTQNVIGSNPVLPTKFIRSVAQSGSAPGLGPGGPRFESLYSDHSFIA
jgi:hypothetical protein